MSECYSSIKRDCAHPVWFPGLILGSPLPKPHMMALACIVTYRLLKGEILLSAKEKKVADRRISVRTMKNCALSDAQTALQRDWIGGIPSGLLQSLKEE